LTQLSQFRSKLEQNISHLKPEEHAKFTKSLNGSISAIFARNRLKKCLKHLYRWTFKRNNKKENLTEMSKISNGSNSKMLKKLDQNREKVSGP
jgi:hypothetical protein